MELKIKKFNQLKSAELYKIIKKRIDIFIVEQNCPYQECDNKDLDSYHLFYLDQNEITAYLRIIPPAISCSEVSIGRVLVTKEYRRQGLARKIMEEAILFIKNNFKESKAIKISAQEYVLKLYQDLGFEVISDRYLEDSIPHYKMSYKLL